MPPKEAPTDEYEIMEGTYSRGDQADFSLVLTKLMIRINDLALTSHIEAYAEAIEQLEANLVVQVDSSKKITEKMQEIRKELSNGIANLNRKRASKKHDLQYQRFIDENVRGFIKRKYRELHKELIRVAPIGRGMTFED